MKKFYTEAAYAIGIVGIALGTALMARADFGVSMVVAPAYTLHLKVSEYLPFFSFGTAEYTLQAFLIILMCLVLRKFRLSYLFSFVTAVIYGFLLDGFGALAAFLPEYFPVRITEYSVGLVVVAASVSLWFHTYISPEVYELFVMEVSKKYSLDLSKLKICYDITSCLIAILMSFIFFGFGTLKGVGPGTIVCALLNGVLISRFSKFFEKRFEFCDGLKLRKYFE